MVWSQLTEGTQTIIIYTLGTLGGVYVINLLLFGVALLVRRAVSGDE